MAGELRREAILERVERHRRVRIGDLSAALGVSGETIRRDLRDLEAEGVLRRVHGGAVAMPCTSDTPLSERMRQNTRAKDRIAQLARGLVRDGDRIFLDTGTTTLALARRLAGLGRVRLHTNSLPVALAASAHFGLQVQMAPGRLRPIEQDLVGTDTLDYIRRFHFDIAFMGIAAIDPVAGFMDIEEDEANVRQALLEHAERRVILADGSKFGRRGNVLTAPFPRVDQLVTDRRLAESFLATARSAGLEVLHD
ncbi:MAG: DeoR/GlpR transcriptional regulator [Rhodobacteraceae bacterium]|nr:DeoR/GlpR transcriptional regulator [Paracoccaceae bacterium]